MKQTVLWLPAISYRSARIESVEREGNRVYTASISSEQAVERWFGREVLGHNEGEIDFTPLLTVGGVLKNHDPRELVGVPTRAWVENKRAYMEWTFGSTARAQEAQQEVDDGMLRGVSVGYRIDAWEELPESDGEGIRATRWSLREASLTAVPADTSVGVGRSAQLMIDVRGAYRRPDFVERIARRYSDPAIGVAGIVRHPLAPIDVHGVRR